MQGGAFETARQIVEFEELVSRLDRINDVVVRPSTTTATTSTSVPPPPPPARASHLAATSLPYERLGDSNPSFARDRNGQQQQRVRVHIGIDEDLRMILEMDPSIVDRTPAPVTLPDNYPVVAQPLRATRPQGWYCTDRH